MSQFVGVLLPLTTVEVDNGHVLRRLLQAIDIDVDTIGIGTGNIERFDATGLAERVLRYTSIECVSCEFCFVGQ